MFRLLENIDGKFMRDTRCEVGDTLILFRPCSVDSQRIMFFILFYFSKDKSFQGAEWQILGNSNTPVDDRALASARPTTVFYK